jgi:hypothetical protein
MLARLPMSRWSLASCAVLVVAAACGSEDSATPGNGPAATEVGPQTPSPTDGLDASTPKAVTAPDASPHDAGGNDAHAEGGAVPSGPCALGANEPMPAAIAPPGPSDWSAWAQEYRGSPDPDPLRTKFQLDISSIFVDIYPRGLDIGQLTLSMGGCPLHPDGAIGQSIPTDPTHTEHGSRFASVLYDPAWTTFRFVPGARYVIEAKNAGALVARITFQAPSDFPSLTAASRTQLSWTPFATTPSDTVNVSGCHLAADGFESKAPYVQLNSAAGSMAWDASDPSLDHAFLSWGRSVKVQGLPRSMTLYHYWIQAF